MQLNSSCSIENCSLTLPRLHVCVYLQVKDISDCIFMCCKNMGLAGS